MKSIIEWLKSSNRLLHILGGFAIGLLCNDWYCAVLTGAAVAGAMEFKDYQWGGKPDIWDFVCTLGGTIIGYLLRSLIF